MAVASRRPSESCRRADNRRSARDVRRRARGKRGKPRFAAVRFRNRVSFCDGGVRPGKVRVCWYRIVAQKHLDQPGRLACREGLDPETTRSASLNSARNQGARSLSKRHRYFGLVAWSSPNPRVAAGFLPSREPFGGIARTRARSRTRVFKKPFRVCWTDFAGRAIPARDNRATGRGFVRVGEEFSHLGGAFNCPR